MGLLNKQIQDSKAINEDIVIDNSKNNKIDELLKLYKKIIQDNKFITNHDKLLEQFNLNPENRSSRAFAGLINEADNGLTKHKSQFKLIGLLLESLGNESTSFIRSAFDKDKEAKSKLDEETLKNPDKYIDLKFFLVETLKNVNISNVDTIKSLYLLKQIYNMENYKSKEQVINNGVNTQPLINEIEKINVKDSSKDDIDNINNIFEIVKETSKKTEENEKKLQEIQNLIYQIKDNFDKIEQQKQLDEQNLETENNQKEIRGF